MEKLNKWQLPVFIAFLFLGFLLSVQFRTQQIYLSDLSLQKTDDLVMILKKLHDKRAELTRELSELENQQHTFAEHANADEALLKSLREDCRKQEMALGIVPVKGPGITVTISEGSSVVYLDLVDIINELWASQAEAISINDVRITPWTYIFWNKEDLTLLVNGKTIAFPCTIKAIGNPDQLESGLRLLGGVLDHLAIYKVYPVVRRHQSLEIPAASLPPIHYLKASNIY